jgi:DNA polymerase-3 subunit epsilon
MVISAVIIVLLTGIGAAMGWATWLELSPTTRDLAGRLGGEVGENLVIAVCLALLVIVVVVNVLYRAYGPPLLGLADEIKMIALSNPAHRPAAQGPAEVRELIAAVTLLADRYQTATRAVQERIQEAAAALEEERDTLGALMAKLSQGVVVCNLEGRVLLYNQQAQRLLAGPARRSGGGDWIGLGRSIHSIVDESLIRHALMTLVHGRQRGEAPVMVPFLAPRPGGALLNVHLVPISAKSRRWHGYILTFEDITDRIARNTRRALAFQGFVERQRTAVASIRAAIEAVLDFPDIDDERRTAFHRLIHDEVLDLSRGFVGIEDQLQQDLNEHLPSRSILASDLIAAIERHVQDALGERLRVSVPVDPVRLRIDSYAIARCLIFLIDRLRQSCGAERLSLALEDGAGHAVLVLSWSGTPLAMDVLRSWDDRNVLADFAGSSMSLREVVDRHSAALWPLAVAADGRPCLRLLLPQGEPALSSSAGPADEGPADQAFDFRLTTRRPRPAALGATSLRELTYIVIDTETTGLSPDKGDEIIAIGAVRIVNGRILRREVFDTFVNPRVPIREESAAIHGISRAMLRGQPRIEEVLPDLAGFVEDTVIVGHNIDFDMRFFRNAAARTGIHFVNPILDTLLLARIVSPNLEDKRLDATASRLGITVVGRHTALGDALTTAEVFLALVPMLGDKDITTLDAALAACDKAALGRPRY